MSGELFTRPPLPRDTALYARLYNEPRPYVRRTSGDPGAPWEVYIPPTRPEHFEYGDVQNGAVLGPWGESCWPSWAEACAFMQECAPELAEVFR